MSQLPLFSEIRCDDRIFNSLFAHRQSCSFFMVAFVTSSSNLNGLAHKFGYSEKSYSLDRRIARLCRSNTSRKRKVWYSSIVSDNQNTRQTTTTTSLNEHFIPTQNNENVDKQLRPVVPILMGSGADIDR